VECKHRCVNVSSVLDPGIAYWPAFGVTEISEDWYRSTMRVIVISLGTPWSAEASFGCTWEHLGAPETTLGTPVPRIGVPMISLSEQAKSLGALRIPLE